MHNRTWMGRWQGWLASVLSLVMLAAAAGSAAAQSNLLQPEEAFQPSAKAVGPDRVRITWKVAEDYYLYREKLDLTVVTPEGAGVNDISKPAGKR